MINLVCFFQMLVWIWPRIPVLSFHRFAENPRSQPYLEHSPNDLKSLVTDLQERGCRPFFPSDHYEGDCQVLFTFDDAYDEHFDWVMPYMESAGWPALFFVPLHMLAPEGSLRSQKQREALQYHYVGAHGLDERSVPELLQSSGTRGLKKALNTMRSTLEERFQRKVDWLALPRGEMHPKATKPVLETFQYYFGVDGGYMDPLLKRGFQDRLMIQADTSRKQILDYIDRARPWNRLETWLLLAFWLLFNLLWWFNVKEPTKSCR